MANKQKYEEQLRNRPGALMEKIMKDAAKKKAVDVHFEDEGDQAWAVIKAHFYEEDTEMAIRLLSGDQWVLLLGYYDDDDEYIELLQPLTQPDIEGIPIGLQKVMRKVLASEEGLRVPANLLAK